jgi:hypothetical protein
MWHVSAAAGWAWSDGEKPDRASGLADGRMDSGLDDSHIDGVAAEAGDVMNVELRDEVLSMFFIPLMPT